MKPQFQHEATTSFALWLDHHLCKNAETFQNKEGELYYKEDDRLIRYPEDPDGFITYSSEYKQWVYNSDVDGASIPDGIYRPRPGIRILPKRRKWINAGF